MFLAESSLNAMTQTKPQIEIIKPSGRLLVTLVFYLKRTTTEEAHRSTVLGHAFEKPFKGSRLRLQRLRHG
jgi:hypothetical protein